jgi:hypothetical protein
MDMTSTSRSGSSDKSVGVWLSICLLLALGYLSAQAQESLLKPNHAKTFLFEVTAKTVVPCGNRGTVCYFVDFSYRFDKKDQLLIKDFGLVPPTGHFRYLTLKDHLDFVDPHTGFVVVSVQLEPTVVPQGTLTMDSPKRSEFPGDAKQGLWNRSTAFIIHLNHVLNSAFLSGYRACEDGEENCFISTYARLDPVRLPKNIRGEVAIQISFRSSSSGNETSFLIRYKVLESLSHSPDWLPPETNEVSKEAELFVDKLFHQMQEAD